MANNFLNYQKRLYQIGDGFDDYYIFDIVEFSQTLETGIKTFRDTNKLGNGEIRLNGLEKNLKGDYILNVTFKITTIDYNDNLNYLLKVFYGKPKKAFFYEKTKSKDLVFTYNYVELVEVFKQELRAVENKGQEYKILACKFRLLFPYYFEPCDDQIKYIDLASFSTIKYDNGLTYDSGLRYDSYLSAIKNIKTLTPEDKINYFANDTLNARIPLTSNDEFLKRETTQINNNLLAYSDNISTSNGWSISNLTENGENGVGFSNERAWRVTYTASSSSFISSPFISVVPNETYILSSDIRLVSGAYSSGGRGLNMFWYDGSNAFISVSSGSTISPDIVSKRFSASVTAPSNAVYGKLFYPFDLGNGHILEYSAPQVELSSLSNYIGNSLSVTLLDNNAYYTDTKRLDLKSSSENNIYIIEFNALAQNEWIKIVNQTNNTEIKITWLDSVANPNRIQFNSFRNSFFDGNNKISDTKIKYEYTTNNLLYFDTLLSTSPITNKTTNNLIFQKSSSTKNQIIIKHLKVNH